MLLSKQKLELLLLRLIIFILYAFVLTVTTDCSPVSCTQRHCGSSEYVIDLMPSSSPIKEGVYELKSSIKLCNFSCLFSVKFDKPLFNPVPSECQLQDNFSQFGCNIIYPYLVADMEILIFVIPIGSEKTNVSLNLTFQGKTIFLLSNEVLMAEKVQPNGPECEPICYHGYRSTAFSY